MINVLIVDDHPSMGEGTKTIIEKQWDMSADIVVDSEKVKELLKETKYDIYLIDLNMPKLNGVDLTKAILQVDPDAIILIYTGFDIVRNYNLLIEVGVAGLLSKTATSEQLITAIRCALRGEAVIPIELLKQLRRVVLTGTGTADGTQSLGNVSLSSREQKILEQVSTGLTNGVIALNLNTSQRTIESSLTKIFTKLGVSSRTEALIKAKEYGLLSLQEVEF